MYDKIWDTPYTSQAWNWKSNKVWRNCDIYYINI